MTKPFPVAERSSGPFDLSKTPIHLESGAPGRLIMVESTPTSWGAWERHTEGDEIVIILEGKGEFIQEFGGEARRTAVGPGSAIINPAGVWHTADVEEPLKAIYITPCPGTQHRAR